jgi:HAD superfamily hydrolase (TIGR01549 family)
MIQTIIFDLDGTLVQTEILKAESYARAAQELNSRLKIEEVMEAFKAVVGLPRREVAETLLKRFQLQEAAEKRLVEFGVLKPWQVFVQIRLQIYEKMLEDPRILHDHLCPHNVGLLGYAREQGLKTGLATMSHCKQAQKVLEILQLMPLFHFIATRDDVENGKPDPEIYWLVARELGVEPRDCLVIEDSPSGVKAALAAGMHCICVTTDFTRKAIHESGLLPKRWIVDEPRQLLAVATALLQEQNPDEQRVYDE